MSQRKGPEACQLMAARVVGPEIQNKTLLPQRSIASGNLASEQSSHSVSLGVYALLHACLNGQASLPSPLFLSCETRVEKEREGEIYYIERGLKRERERERERDGERVWGRERAMKGGREKK